MYTQPQTTLVALAAAMALLLSLAATGLVRRFAIVRAILDVPNHRSSHKVPTPRGGGAAIVVSSFFGIATLWAGGIVELRTAVGILGGGGVVALAGWIDDNRGLSARYRAIVQGAAAVWAVWWLGGLAQLSLGPFVARPGAFSGVIAVLIIVWCTNLFNFMDGIDGIAAGQAAASGIVGGALFIANGRTDLGSIAFVIAAASVGFLFWNWSPAKIFMGDVGSSALGFVFATLAIVGESSGAVPLLVSMLLGGAFVVDATVTLLRRILRGEKWYEAHRAHAYQRAVLYGLSHRQVASAVVITSLLLGLAAFMTRTSPRLQLAVVVLGFTAWVAVYLLVERGFPMVPKRGVSEVGDSSRSLGSSKV